jgi:hypothetical protein
MLPPETLRNLYRTAIERLWDADAHEASREPECAEMTELEGVAGIRAAPDAG